MENFLFTYNLKNLVKKRLALRTPRTAVPLTLYLLINISFFNNDVIGIGLSDFHEMPLTILNYIKCKPKILT